MPFPWTPAYADSGSLARIVEDQGGCVTPIWQAECPECAEESSDDLWEAAFEHWLPVRGQFGALPNLEELLGLSTNLVPSLYQAVCPTVSTPRHLVLIK